MHRPVRILVDPAASILHCPACSGPLDLMAG